MKFNRTAQAAIADKTTKWDLIAAIAEDAVENGFPITGVDSQLAAREALEVAGNEYATRTITDLCLVAKFDHESTKGQRRIWRSHGWSIVHQFASAGATQESAAGYLAGARRTRREVQAYLSSIRTGTYSPVTAIEPSVDDAWKAWLNAANRLMLDGAKLAERSEDGELGTYASLGQMIYERMTERKLDAEIRSLLESDEASI